MRCLPRGLAGQDAGLDLVPRRRARGLQGLWTQSLRAGLAVVVLVGCASTAQEPLSSPPYPEATAPTRAAPEAGGDAGTSGPADGLACGVSLPRDLSSEDEIAQTLVIFQPAGGELESPWAPRLGGVFLE